MHYLGIDLAKASFQVTLRTPAGKQKQKRCDNTPAGFQELLAWLQRQGVTQFHACMEATGTYGEALALFLYEQGFQVSVVNPKKIAHYAQSKLSRAKTDKADAALIALFCEKETPALWAPPPPEVRELQALVRRLSSLEAMRQMEQNRLLAAAHPEPVLASLKAHLAYLDQAIADTQQQIHDHLDGHPRLKQCRDLLTSIPGIGEKTAAWLLAELSYMDQFQNVRQPVAFAGLTPRVYESGATVKKRGSLCKLGSSRIRRALYFPAMSAMQHNPLVKALVKRLREQGKKGKLVVGAAMRKLLHLAYGVLKSGKPFDPAWTAAVG
jgi:transposase